MDKNQIEKATEQEERRFIVYFLNEDEEQSVYVEEVNKVDFSKILNHIYDGGSVFIAQRKKPKHDSYVDEYLLEEFEKTGFFC
ncbi:MAG: hypothetical protein QXH91_05270 [Candidatus Bathyarchaeia archaeon]